MPSKPQKNSKSVLTSKITFDKRFLLTGTFSVILTCIIVLYTYLILGFAPFGDKALIYKDGQQQMVDLLCWYKDVLSGKSSIVYTFTKYLGGTNFAVFSYYLASPLNLLIVFFDKSQASLFMNILFILKVSLAALFTDYYLCKRFKPVTRLNCFITVMLSVSYGLSQYLIAQSNTIMWLDGAYMLPLMFAGVERLISKRKSTLFIVSTGLALCFNWYTGIINLMFSGLWFLFESLRSATVNEAGISKKGMQKAFGLSVLRFSLSCISALLMSAVILLPTLSLLSGRSYGQSGIRMLTDLSFIGSVPNIISNYSFGTVSVKGGVNLFAGSLVFFGVVLLFIASSKALKEKLVYGALLLVTILSFYWQPLVALFSMLRNVDSLWYRYSYGGSLALIYLAAVFFIESDKKKLKIWMPPCISAIYTVIVFIMTDPVSPSTQNVILTSQLAEIIHVNADYFIVPLISKIIFPWVLSVLLCLDIYLRNKKRDCFKISAALSSIILVAELTLGQMVLGNYYATSDVPAISAYTKQQAALLDTVDDPSFYRMVQTSFHSIYHGLPASYNEAMAYGYPSVTSFVSAPDENSIAFLDRAGYPGYYDTIPVTISENLALDSLLSVKYVMLPSGDGNNSGLEYVNGIDGFKALYLNPYSVPMAFVTDYSGDYESNSVDPAGYLNDMYHYLSGTEKDILLSVPSDKIISEQEGAVYRYTVEGCGDTILYANIVTNTEEGAMLNINGEQFSPYSTTLSPTLVRVNTVNGKADLELVFNNDNGSNTVTDAQFYYLDLNALKEVTSGIQSRSASVININDGHCYFEVDNAAAGSSLFTSVPYNKGWEISVNGQKANCNLIGNTFMSIPLEDGKNIIEMSFRVPNLSIGIAATITGVLLLAGMAITEHKQNGTDKNR